jgi:hypothetical protein
MGIGRKTRGAAAALEWFPSLTAPKGYTVADGTTLAVASCRPSFIATLYCGDADNATADHGYRCNNADGTGRNIAGAYIVKPDMRDRFAKGFNSGGARKINKREAAKAGSIQWRGLIDDGDDTMGTRRAIEGLEIQGAQVIGPGAAIGWSGMQTVDVTPGDLRPDNVAWLPCMRL